MDNCMSLKYKPRLILILTAALLLAVAVGYAVLQLQRGKTLDSRHSARAWIETFSYQGSSFADYRGWAETQLRQGLQREELPPALAPFRLEPAADCPVGVTKPWLNGIVLTHDVQESPYQLREMAEYFRERCFVVLLPLLPGHGTVPGDLLRSTWQDWVALQQLAARELGAEVDNLFLGGHGVGATLALLEAFDNIEVDALVLFAPVLAPQALPWYAPLAHTVGGFVQAAAWAEVYPDDTPYRHDSWPWRLRQQVNALVAVARARLPGRTMGLPVFALASMEDAEANPQAILDYMRQVQHPDKQTLLYSRRELPAEAAVSIVSTQRPDLRLLGQGHEALLLSLGDAVFGQFGTYYDCRHYYPGDAAAWARCRAGEFDYRGEPAPDTLDRGLLQKAAFNLFLPQLHQELDGFIAPVARIPAVVPF